MCIAAFLYLHPQQSLCIGEHHFYQQYDSVNFSLSFAKCHSHIFCTWVWRLLVPFKIVNWPCHPQETTITCQQSERFASSTRKWHFIALLLFVALLAFSDNVCLKLEGKTWRSQPEAKESLQTQLMCSRYKWFCAVWCSVILIVCVFSFW